MKRVVVLLYTLCAAFFLQAQHMSVESFRVDESDLDARVVKSVLDQNGEKCALVKVESTEKGFAFDVGVLGVSKVDETPTAETWVYVPHGAMRMRIAHADLGTLEYEFSMAIREATVYRLKLTSDKVKMIVEESAGGQYLVIYTDPEVAEIQIDNQIPTPITNGEYSAFLTAGEHICVVSARNYHSKTFSFNSVDGKGRHEEQVNLVANYGHILIETNVKADVEINGIVIGETSIRSGKLPLGTHMVKVSSEGYAASEMQVTLTEGGETENHSVDLVPYFSEITIRANNNEEAIFINDEYKGTGSWQGRLMPATYLLKCERKGHRSTIQQLEVRSNTPQTITLNAPTPMYGRLRIDSTPIGAEVWLDGELLGETPNVFSNIIVGEKELTLRKDGYVEQLISVKVEEGKVAYEGVDMQEKPQVTTGALRVNAKQDDVKVWSGGHFLGYADEIIEGISPSINVVSVSKNGYESVAQSVDIKAGELTVLEVDLKKEKKERNLNKYPDIESRFLLIGEMSAGTNFSLGGGGMAGYVKKNGGYVKCLYGTHDLDDYPIHYITAGYLRYLSQYFYLYTGVGYGSISWAEQKENGVALDLGVVGRYGGLAVSAGISSVNFEYWYFNLGMGVML